MTIKITPADYETKDGEYPDLHLVRSNWTPHRLFKSLFFNGHATVLSNGNYILVNFAHVCLINNISINTSKYSIDISDHSIKVPDIKLSSVELLRVCESGLVFGNDQGETIIGFTYIIPIIKAFGKPDLIESGPNYPIRLTFGEIEILIAPRIESEGNVQLETYDMDLQTWLPEMYGMKLRKLNRYQILDILSSMNPDTPISEVINYIHTIEVETIPETKFKPLSKFC